MTQTYSKLTPECIALLEELKIPCFVHEFDEKHKARRRQVFTATDIPVLLGYNDYKSVRELFREKLGLVPEFAGNARTMVGQYVEPLLLSMAILEEADALREMIANGITPVMQFGLWVCHSDYPLGATLDLAITDFKSGEVLRVFEAKHTSSNWTEVPMRVASQCWAQAFAAGVDSVTVVYTDNDGIFKFEDVDLTSTAVHAMEDAVTAYWPSLSDGEVPLEEPVLEAVAPKVKGEKNQVQASEHDLANEALLRDALADIANTEKEIEDLTKSLKLLKEEADELKASLSAGLPMGTTKVLANGILYRSQRVVGNSLSHEKAAAEYSRRMTERTEPITPEEAKTLWLEAVANNTHPGRVSTSVTYRPNKEK